VAGSERRIFRLRRAWWAQKAKFTPVAAEEAKFVACDGLKRRHFSPGVCSETYIFSLRRTQKAIFFTCGALRKKKNPPVGGRRGEFFACSESTIFACGELRSQKFLPAAG